MFYSVLVARNIDSLYQYESEDVISIGTVVQVDFNGNLSFGVVYSIDSKKNYDKLKKIDKISNYIISDKIIKFLEFFSKYNLVSLGNALKMLLNEDIFKIPRKKKIPTSISSYKIEKEILLNDFQKEIYEKIGQETFNVFVINGVTGSGKTMVFLKCIKDQLIKGKQVLLLLPEIALSDQIVNICKNYGLNPFVYNSFVKDSEKREIWKGVINKDIKFVIGTRSALFLPFKSLGLIVVDEEHDTSYKQEENPIYNARDMAVSFANILNIPIILSSATPSLETIYNVKCGKYIELVLNSRYNNVLLPSVEVINKPKFGLFSVRMTDAIQNSLDKKEQVLIYYNKRGYSSISYCTECGYVLECPNCSSYLVRHDINSTMQCHYCFYSEKIDSKCKKCGAINSIKYYGYGVEKIYQMLRDFFKDATIEIASSDSLNSPDKIKLFLERVHNKQIDIIIGTQIIAKGHNFENLKLVCILDMDEVIKSPDIRSYERAFQFFTQVSGRAGRFERGHVIVQTDVDDFDIYKLLNKDDFIEKELDERKKYNLPPFFKMASIIIKGVNEKSTKDIAYKVMKFLNFSNVEVLGPIPAPIYKINNKYRWRILLKYSKNLNIQKFLKTPMLFKNKNIKIDIDPISFF